VELEKPELAGVVVGLLLEVSVGVLGVNLVVVTPNAGVLTLEGSDAVVIAVLELGVDAVLEVDVGFAVLVEALEVGGVTGVAGGVVGVDALEDGGVTALAAVTPTAVLVEVTGA
jgi:hypothetical protein